MASTPASRPAAANKSSARAWTSTEIDLLGTAPDKAVAKQIGRTTMAVTLKRSKLCIQSCNPEQRPKNVWEDLDAVAKLGRVPDAQLADELGVHVSSVCAARKARSIPACNPKHSRPTGAGRWGEVNSELLGTLPDREIADRIGVTRTAVVAARKRRGIAPGTQQPDTAVAAWQSRLGLTDRAAAAALGMTLAGYQRQKLGRDQHGAPREASRALLLACAAVEAGLQPINQSSPAEG